MLSDEPDFISWPEEGNEEQERKFIEGFNWDAFGKELSKIVDELARGIGSINFRAAVQPDDCHSSSTAKEDQS